MGLNKLFSFLLCGCGNTSKITPDESVFQRRYIPSLDLKDITEGIVDPRYNSYSNESDGIEEYIEPIIRKEFVHTNNTNAPIKHLYIFEIINKDEISEPIEESAKTDNNPIETARDSTSEDTESGEESKKEEDIESEDSKSENSKSTMKKLENSISSSEYDLDMLYKLEYQCNNESLTLGSDYYLHVLYRTESAYSDTFDTYSSSQFVVE